MRVVLLLVMLQALATSAFAISPRMVTGAIDFRFAKNSVALSATERERLYLKLSELKAAGLCTLEYVVIVGHPRTGTGCRHTSTCCACSTISQGPSIPQSWIG